MKRKIVVGALYERCARVSQDIIPINQLKVLTKTQLSDLILVAGQGLTECDRELIEYFGQANGVEVEDESGLPLAKDTHKHRQTNILIRAPKSSGNEDSYDLSVNEVNELVLDHQSGYHVQGSLGFEAARQAAINSFELRHRNLSRKVDLILKSHQIEYEVWLFPLPATLYLEYVDTGSRPDRWRWRFAAKMKMLQAGIVVWKAVFELEACDAGKLDRAERQALLQALSRFKNFKGADQGHA